MRIKIDGPHELLAYLPYRFGFVPRESLAVLAVLDDGPDELALGMAARLDIADVVHPEVMAIARAGLLAQLGQDPTVCAYTVLYTSETLEDVRSGITVPGRVLRDWLATFPYGDPTTTMIVTPAVFACLECAEPLCCPEEGHPVDRLQDTAVAAQMVLQGETLASSREELGCPRTTDAQRAASAARAASRETRAMRKRHPAQQQRSRDRMLKTFGEALAKAAPGGRWTPDPDLLGRFGAALADPDLRDAVVAWTVGGRPVRASSPHVMEAFEGMITGSLRSPAPEHLDAASTVLSEVVRHAPPGGAGYALAVLGWLAWWRGEGARADVLLAQCLGEDPGCTLGLLLADVLDGGVRPGWARPDAYAAPRRR